MTLPLPRNRMLQGSVAGHQILLAIADAAVVFPPCHLAGVSRQIGTGDVVMNADLSAARAGGE